MTSLETVDSGANKQVESVKIDALNLPSQGYGKSNETIDAGIGIRNITFTLQDYTGDYSDGDVTINANTTITRDMYYDKLVVSSGYRLTTTGYRVYARQIIIDNGGIISANGNNGSVGGTGTDGILQTNPSPQGLGGAGGAGGTATASGTIFGTTAGVSGGAGNRGTTFAGGGFETGTAGTNGTSVTHSLCSLGGNAGGTGGYRGVGPGASGGTGGTVTTYKGEITNPFLATHLIGFDGTNISLLRSGGIGGGGGGGGGGNSGAASFNLAGGGGGGGGGSGASGGICYLWAKQIINNGTIEAKGGNGGNGGNGGSIGSGSSNVGCGGAGGAGGNGGVVLLACGQYLGSGTINVGGGTGGTGGDGDNSDPTNGNAGAVGLIIRVTL